MSSITIQTVGEIAAQSLAAVRVFEKHGIDYCCGGQRSLDDACRERGIDTEALLGEVEAACQTRGESDRDWADAPLKDLIDHIVAKHHAYLRYELPHIEQRMTKVLEAHRRRHGDILIPLGRVFADLKAELEMHMRKEETILFPFIVRAEQSALAGVPWTPPPFGTIGNPIRIMEHEHESAGHALQEIWRLTSRFALPEDACATYRALYAGLAELERDLHMHIHLENNILFPRALEMEPAFSKRA